MAATEKIGGVELSVYGLRLAKMEGNFDLPKFKQIVDEHDFESNLLVLDEKTIKVRLIGFYESKAALGSALTSFYNKIASAIKLNWIFTKHEIDGNYVVKDGITASTFGSSVELVITLTNTD